MTSKLMQSLCSIVEAKENKHRKDKNVPKSHEGIVWLFGTPYQLVLYLVAVVLFLCPEFIWRYASKITQLLRSIREEGQPLQGTLMSRLKYRVELSDKQNLLGVVFFFKTLVL